MARDRQIRALEQVIRASRRVDFAFQLDDRKGVITVECEARPAVAKQYLLRLSTWVHEHFSGKRDGDQLPDNLRVPLRRIKRRYPGASLRLDKITCVAQACPVKGKALKLLIARALGEAFGGKPTAGALAEAAAAASDRSAEALALLRTGARGIKRWNALGKDERKDRGRFRRANLSGAALDGVDFGDLDLQRANLRGACLKHAGLTGCNLNQADLRAANLSRVSAVDTRFHSTNLEGARLAGGNFWSAKFRGASLRNADLRRAELNDTDFCGADLTGADLRGIKVMTRNKWTVRYDDRTRFPTGYRPGREWRLTGAKR